MASSCRARFRRRSEPGQRCNAQSIPWRRPVITEPDLDHFFGGLETRFEGSAEYSRHAARFISSNFSVFRYITGEPLLSDILADLIDPAGTHGQGDSFLFLFLELVEK